MVNILFKTLFHPQNTLWDPTRQPEQGWAAKPFHEDNLAPLISAHSLQDSAPPEGRYKQDALRLVLPHNLNPDCPFH